MGQQEAGALEHEQHLDTNNNNNNNSSPSHSPQPTKPQRGCLSDENNNDQDELATNKHNLLLGSPIELRPRPPEGTNLARELLQAFRRHSDRELLADAKTGQQWTGAAMGIEVGRIASALRRQVGLLPGQVVMTICEHGAREILVALGAVLAGGSLFGTSSQDGYEEEKVLCEIVPPHLIATESRFHALAVRLRNEVAGLEGVQILWVDDSPTRGSSEEARRWLQLARRDQVHLLHELLEQQPEPDEQLLEQVSRHEIDSQQHVLTFMLTSGSTGRPKVVPSTHQELMWGLHGMMAASRATPTMLPVHRDSVMAGDLPLDHGAGINLVFLGLLEGAKLVVLPSFEEAAFWQGVHDFRITTSIGSTSFCYKLLTHLKASRAHSDQWDLSSLRYLYCVGAKVCFHELIGELRASRLQQVCFGQAYGCTEIGFISVLRPADCAAHLDSVGHLFPGVLAKVVHPDSGEPLPLGETGELLVKARSQFKGYRCWRDDDSRKLTHLSHDHEGFYRTGDQASFDSEHRLHIRGRFKDTLFLMGDWKILPAELEELIDSHPLVESSAVVGVPDPEVVGVHLPRAFVKLYAAQAAELDSVSAELRNKLMDGEAAVAEHIFQFAAQRTAPAKHLRGGVRILQEFPRVGLLKKVDRNALKAMA